MNTSEQRQALREGLAERLHIEWCRQEGMAGGWVFMNEFGRLMWYAQADAILAYLHSQGVRLTLEGELPEPHITKATARGHADWALARDEVFHYRDFVLKGYSLTARIIEET